MADSLATASVASRNEGVTFNAAGVHASTTEFATTAKETGPRRPLLHRGAQVVIDRFEEHGAHAAIDLHVTNYRLQGDPLTLQAVIPIAEAQGKQVEVASWRLQSLLPERRAATSLTRSSD